ncbi:LAMI_0H16358g1_1 [Lachancea mirantina]|uniref:LAMI_0H16358g1_1 n=1 Tax=Lachancea mirantina TaxID=1230905 RepID=A0A1G4KIZ7_9SACH|nr:LAMI_0H16358g1_1 [Lachancea mirantina]
MINESPLRKRDLNSASVSDRGSRGFHGDHLSTSPARNVYRSLSTSPAKKMQARDLTQPARRLSPKKRSREGDFEAGFQTTPKRLQSPTSLQDHLKNLGTVSVDRVKFEKDNSAVKKLKFPVSPAKTQFSSSQTLGGDGSLSRIRTRFGGGLKSPQRALSGKEDHQRPVDATQRILTSKLDAEADKPSIKSMGFDVIHQKAPHLRFGSPEPAPNRKRVKFELSNDPMELKKEVSELRSLLEELNKRQDELEARLSRLEERRKGAID